MALTREQILTDLDKWANLIDNWDSYDGCHTTKASIAIAKQLLERVPPFPQWNAPTNGGVQYYWWDECAGNWTDSGDWIEVEACADGTFGYLKGHNKTFTGEGEALDLEAICNIIQAACTWAVKTEKP